MARRPRRTTIDPAWLQHGDIGAATADYDEYFADEPGTHPLGVVLDKLLGDLPELEADAVAMVCIAGLSYREAGEYQGCDKKTVWRRVQRGLARLAEKLSTQWAAELLQHHLADGVDPAVVGPELYDAFWTDAYRHSQ